MLVLFSHGSKQWTCRATQMNVSSIKADGTDDTIENI